ncbi:MAG TPA: papain-like cysteine protease family protein [Blastocatellia bacterium]|nr:papain-like cysteine protease family protein [Blastocatellia bacterium]
MSLRVSGTPVLLGPSPRINGTCLRFEEQDDEEWCWAVCVEMVLKHYEVSTDEQCRIAQKGLALIGAAPVCCTIRNEFNNNPDCKRRLSAADITRLRGKYPEIPVEHISGMPADEANLADRLRQLLNAGILVEIGYRKPGESHVVMLFGWSVKPTNNNIVFHVHDPKGSPNTIITAAEN